MAHEAQLLKQILARFSRPDPHLLPNYSEQPTAIARSIVRRAPRIAQHRRCDPRPSKTPWLSDCCDNESGRKRQRRRKQSVELVPPEFSPIEITGGDEQGRRRIKFPQNGGCHVKVVRISVVERERDCAAGQRIRAVPPEEIS